MKPCSFARRSSFLLGASLALAITAPTASAAILYEETFDDATFASNTQSSNATVAGGDLDMSDASPTGRHRFTVVQDFISHSYLTFSFKVSAPMTQADPIGAEDPDQALTTDELLIRVGTGTTHNTLSSSEDVLEAVVFRDGNRGGYTNSGNETIFLIANNTNAAVDYTNPVTNTTASLGAFSYASFVRNDAGGAFSVLAAATAFQDLDAVTPGLQYALTRFGIGNASNANQGTVSIDNVLVQDQISFLNPVPEPAGLALIGLGSTLILRRRRSA